MKIAILGAGAFGTALGGVLSDNGYVVDYYDPAIFNVTLTKVLEGAQIVLLVAPSTAVGGLLVEVPKELPLIVATKGLLTDEVFKGREYAVISGPGFADEIKAHHETKLTVTDMALTEMFRADYMEFDFTEDKLGVLMCGALKNVYAILAGMKNLRPGTEAHERYIREVVEEMRGILAANGAVPTTVDLACGEGDLRLTCAEPSRNYEFGQLVRENPDYQPEKTVEGLAALEKIYQGEVVVPEGAKYLTEMMRSFRRRLFED